MPTVIECPSCGRRLRVPEELAAAQVQCPSCGIAFSAQADAAPLTGVTEPGAMVASRCCPYCREDIPREAIRCRFCGEAVDETEGASPPWQRSGEMRRDSEPHRGKLLLALGIVGLVLSGLYGLCVIGIPLGLTVWNLARNDLRRMRTQEMDPEGELLTRAGKTCGLIGVVLGGLWLFVFLAFFLLAADL